MVQETASPLPLGWGSGPLAVLPGSPLGLVPGTWRALSEHLLNERRGGRARESGVNASRESETCSEAFCSVSQGFTWHLTC